VVPRDDIYASLIAAEQAIDTSRTTIVGSQVGITAFTLILLPISTFLVSKPMTAALFSLVDGAKQIQAKNYNIQVDVKTDDEFGQLAYAFNDMVFDIRNYTENLEQLVHERTVELERASSEISLLNEKLQEENLRLGAELNVARRLQLIMLPHQDELAAISDLDIAGYMDPADV
jgi:sigma-B regulation protein RsbU (phosphoserine phosphatase)